VARVQRRLSRPRPGESRALCEPEEIYRSYSLDPAKPILVFTQHSVTTEFESAADQVKPSLEAIEDAGREWGCQTLLTYPNDDAGGRRIVAELERVAEKKLPFIRLNQTWDASITTER